MAVGIALSSDGLPAPFRPTPITKTRIWTSKRPYRDGECADGPSRWSGSYGKPDPSATMGSFPFMTFLLGIKFILRPVMTTKEAMAQTCAKKRAIQSIVCGVLIGLICGFIGAGGGMMMLLILTSVMGYELKNRRGQSVFIMTFTALTGAVSHFTCGMPTR